MSKRIVFTLLIVLLVFTLMPKPAQGIDFTALPMPFNLQPGVRYQRGSMRFMFNNGYLSVWQAGGSTIYMFKWNDGWKEYKVIKHVIADLKRCIVSSKRIYRERGVFFRPVNTVLKPGHVRSVSPAKWNTAGRAVLESKRISIRKPVFFTFALQSNVEEFVRNKVPDADGSFYRDFFSCKKACGWFVLFLRKPLLLEV